MKTKFTFLSIFAVLFIGISIFTISCKKDEVSDYVTYKGKVVYKGTSTPFPDLEVKLTDGTNVSAANKTDEEGKFSFKVDIATINGNYYFLVGDATCIPQRVEIPGFGEKECDLGVIEVEGPSLPIVRTKPMTDVTAESAVGGGFVDEDGRLEIFARGICYSQSEYPTIEDAHTQDGSGKGEFTSTLKNLEHSVIYYVRAYATNKKGTSYGEQVKFITEAGMAVVTTNLISNIAAESAICGGEVSSTGGFPITERGVCWATHQYPSITDSKLADGAVGVGKYIMALSNLEPSTTYYVRAYATNTNGTAYGEQQEFTTTSGLPELTTIEPTNIRSNQATCGGNISSNGGYSLISCGVCWSSSTASPTIADSKIDGVAKLGIFSVTITSLTANTTYYARAYAQNKMGIIYGDTKTFTTTSGLPTVTINAPVAKATSIFIQGTIEDNGGFAITERGICYSTNNTLPSISNQHINSGQGNGSFDVTIPELVPSTTYYIRAYATNTMGTSYSKSCTVQTTDGKPIVTTSTTYEKGIDYLVISASTMTESEVPITRQGICWSTIDNPSIMDNVVEANKNTNSFSCRINGLQSGTTYYCRAFAENLFGLTYGKALSYTTEYGPTILSGHVYDQDGNPIKGARVSGWDITGYSATTDDNGYYSITLGKRMFGNYEFCASAENYQDKISQTTIVGGKETQLDFTLPLEYPFAVDFGNSVFLKTGSAWQMTFACNQSSLMGKTTTKIMRIKNYRSVALNWSLSNMPSKGVNVSKSSGTIPAKGEISITFTFTYPTTSAQLVNVSGCSAGTKAYVWNWESIAGNYAQDDIGNISYSCCASCWQNPYITVGDYSEAFTLIFNQFVILR